MKPVLYSDVIGKKRGKKCGKEISDYGKFIIRGSVIDAYPLIGEDSQYARGGPHGSRNSWLFKMMEKASETENYGNFFDMSKIQKLNYNRGITTVKHNEQRAIFPNNERGPDHTCRGLNNGIVSDYLFYKWCCCIMKEKNDIYFVSDKSLERLALWAEENGFRAGVVSVSKNRTLWKKVSMSRDDINNLISFFEEYPVEKEDLERLFTSGEAEDMFDYYCHVAFIHEIMLNHEGKPKIHPKTKLYAFEHVLRMMITDNDCHLLEEFDRDVTEDDSEYFFEELEEELEEIPDVEIKSNNNKRPAEHEIVQNVAKQPRVEEFDYPPSPTPSLFSLPEIE